MSDAPIRARPSAKRARSAATTRPRNDDAEALLFAEFDAMMERSGKRLEKLNADLDQMLSRMDSARLRT